MFGSRPDYFHCERAGTKPNTVRAIDPEGIKYLKNNHIWKIRIFNTEYPDEEFTRDITNVSLAEMYPLEDGRVLTVFSWKHPDSENEILSRAISHYGEPAQVLKCIEELAELAVELCHPLYSRDEEDDCRLLYLERAAKAMRDYAKEITCPFVGIHKKKIDHASVASELADVSLTTTQMLKIFNCSEEVEKIKQEKLSRLEARMGGDEK
jgi:hypothetical protein